MNTTVLLLVGCDQTCSILFHFRNHIQASSAWSKPEKNTSSEGQSTWKITLPEFPEITKTVVMVMSNLHSKKSRAIHFRWDVLTSVGVCAHSHADAQIWGWLQPPASSTSTVSSLMLRPTSTFTASRILRIEHFQKRYTLVLLLISRGDSSGWLKVRCCKLRKVFQGMVMLYASVLGLIHHDGSGIPT